MMETDDSINYYRGRNKGQVASRLVALMMKSMHIQSACKLATAMCAGLVLGFLIPATTFNRQRNITSAFPPGGASMTANTTSRSSTDHVNQTVEGSSKIQVEERLPPGIVVSESDLYPRRLWGNPSEDLTVKPNYLVSFTVGYNQMDNIDAAVKKFSGNFTVVLFHYDGMASAWDKFEWSKRAIHVSAAKQTKWWYAKRFLHPDIVAPYDYIFLWDEDLGVEHFDSEEYIKLVKKFGLEISQPGLEYNKKTYWEMTKRRADSDVHKETKEKPGLCHDPHSPPCAAFVEIMAPVFSRDAWRCVWHMIQNDLVHGWGLDFYLHRCVETAGEKIGVVDAQWIVHQFIPSLNQGRKQGLIEKWMHPSQGVRHRCRKEVDIFSNRMANAERSYHKSMELNSSNTTGQT